MVMVGSRLTHLVGLKYCRHNTGGGGGGEINTNITVDHKFLSTWLIKTLEMVPLGKQTKNH